MSVCLRKKVPKGGKSANFVSGRRF